MIKFFYVVDYWVPGYTGVVNIISGSDREVYDIIAEKRTVDYVGEYYSEIKSDYEYDPKYARIIVRNILQAQRFPLAPAYFGSKAFYSGIVHFTSAKLAET